MRSHDPDKMTVTPLESFPPPHQWDEWTEFDADAWPRKVEKRYSLIPTICFNCEAACGLMAYVDKDTKQIRKLEGNPYHAGSRGKNCAKGPATLNQINDPGRILYPLKRVGPRGSGKFERTSWDEVLNAFAAQIRKAIVENRKNEIMYHVGRPGEDGYVTRILQTWGVDGHNSHTNVCSSSARVGYALWSGSDRPSPDHANAKFIVLLSSHLETGHYFNPHAQRIIDGKRAGSKICVIDVRLSNTASMADWWLATWPGTEALLLLSFAHVLLHENLFNRAFVEQWVNWREFPSSPATFDAFIEALKTHYSFAAPENVPEETGVDASTIREIARAIGAAGSAFSSHVWRNAASGNVGGWQVARCLQFLTVLTGAMNAVGGTSMAAHNKFVPGPPTNCKPPPQKEWNTLLYPPEWPLAYHEMSFLLPHMLMEGRGKIAAYFTRVYNPVWTNPDGMMWERVLRDESKIELHAALTPVWSETAQYADYVLPMGNGAERHDLMSHETHAAKWIGFRQPVLRVLREREGEKFEFTWQANLAGPGEVWEEAEFWVELSWRIDPDGSLGIRKYHESPYRPGQKITMDEYYGWIFENSVPGLPAAAKKEGLTPLQYMRKYGAFLVEDEVYEGHLKPLAAEHAQGAQVRDDGSIVGGDGKPIGVMIDGKAVVGFNTPSKKLELFSPTMRDWKWPDQSMPAYIESHVHRKHMSRDRGEFVLVPTFRLPTLIHTRSANAKWLYELSNSNPVWIHTEDAARLGLKTGDLVRITTRIGHYINKAWVTEGMRPGVVACSHHLGRWRLFDDVGTDRWASSKVAREEVSPGVFRFRRVEDVQAYESADPDTRRIWWSDGGVHQNLTFPVQPDPVSGMHCWHQRVTVEKAREGDAYGDIVVDTNKSMEVYREWLKLARPGPGPGNLRRPLWLDRAVKPAPEAYVLK